MQVVSIVAPTPFLTSDVVRARLGVGTSIDDARLSAFTAAACALLDGPAGWLGRSIGSQTIEVALAEMPRRIRLPYPPVDAISVVSFDGNAVDPSMYTFDGIRTLYAPGGLAGCSGCCDREDRFRVRYTAGYQPNATPAPIEQAVVMAVAKMLTMSRPDSAIKQDTVVGVSSTAWETSADFTAAFDRAAECLLGPYRVFD